MRRIGIFSATGPPWAHRVAIRAAGAVLLVLAVTGSASAALKITGVSANAPAGIRSFFTKQVEVFGVRLYATSGVPDGKLLHAAGVMAQYLDNDADGRVDNRRVVVRMVSGGAAMVLFVDPRQTDEFFGQLDEDSLDGLMLQDLSAEETHPGGAERGIFDASLEEVLHLITHVGYAEAYPKQFGEKRGTRLAKAMDVARGGHFDQVPDPYPPSAWYTYDDRTCEYSCMVTEYVYWGLTSILGAQSFAGRLEEIEAEWKLNTAAKVRSTDRRLWRLLRKKRFKFPTRLPDGDYQR